MQRLREELQEVTLVVGIDENAEVLDRLVVFLHDRVAVLGEHLVHAVPNRLVVRVGNREEVDAAATEFGDRVQFVVGAEREVLHARRVVVPVEVFLDLALLLAFGGLVDRHLDEVIAARHHLRHERRVFGANVLIVEVLEHREAQHLLIPRHPVVHLAFLNVADRVIDILEAAGVCLVVRVEREVLDLAEAGHERAAVLHGRQAIRAGARHKGVHSAAVGLDARERHGAVLVRVGLRLIRALAAVLDRLLPRLLGVEDRERDVLHPVAVPHGLARGLPVLRKRTLEHDANVALREQVHRAVARARREVSDLLDLEAERTRVEERRLLRVAHVKAHVVDVDQLQGIGRGRNRSGRTQRGHRPRSYSPRPLTLK